MRVRESRGPPRIRDGGQDVIVDIDQVQRLKGCQLFARAYAATGPRRARTRSNTKSCSSGDGKNSYWMGTSLPVSTRYTPGHERGARECRFYGCAHEMRETATVSMPMRARKCRQQTRFGPLPSRGHRLCAGDAITRRSFPLAFERQRESFANPFHSAWAPGART